MSTESRNDQKYCKMFILYCLSIEKGLFLISGVFVLCLVSNNYFLYVAALHNSKMAIRMQKFYSEQCELSKISQLLLIKLCLGFKC